MAFETRVPQFYARWPSWRGGVNHKLDINLINSYDTYLNVSIKQEEEILLEAIQPAVPLHYYCSVEPVENIISLLLVM